MSETAAPSATIVARIQKLLALAGNNPNENEAAAAAAKVQELLASYNLDMNDVQRTEEGRTKTLHSRSAMYPFQQVLMRTLAANNFCLHFVDTSIGRKRHMVVGLKSNVAVTLSMYDYLATAIERLLPYPQKERMSRSAMSWKAGVADRLCERLLVQRREQEKAQAARQGAAPGGATGGNALVVLTSNERDANFDFYYGDAPGTMARLRAKWVADQAAEKAAAAAAAAAKPETPAQRAKREAQEEKARQRWHQRWARQASKVDKAAYNAGRQVGDTIGLDPQVPQGAPLGKLG